MIDNASLAPCRDLLSCPPIASVMAAFSVVRPSARWSQRWGSNPRPAVYETAALPLSYVGAVVAAGSKFVNEALGRYLNDIYSCLETHRDQQAQSVWAQPLSPRRSETLSPHIGRPEP